MDELKVENPFVVFGVCSVLDIENQKVVVGSKKVSKAPQIHPSTSYA